MKRFFNWIINTFSYTQIYCFIYLLFILSFLPIAIFWVQTNLQRLALIDEQLDELQKVGELKNLYDAIQQHRLLAQRYAYDSNKETYEQMIQLEKRMVREVFEAGGALDSHKKVESSNDVANWQKVDLFDHYTRWNEIINKTPHVSSKDSEFMHTALLNDIHIEFGYLADRVGISYFNQINKYILIQSIYLILTSLQESLSQLILMSEKILNNQQTELAQDQILALIDVINSNIKYLKDGIDIYSRNLEDKDLELKQIMHSTSIYIASVNDLISVVKQNILHAPTPDITLADFEKQSKETMQLGYKLWDSAILALTHIFEIEKSLLLNEFWITLAATIILISIAFFLGLKLTHTGIKRISQLTQATENFTNGNLAVRIPDPHKDEIGRQAQAFNRMAQKLEELIEHLYELLNATTALANGNLTARIPTFENEHEFSQVALSFNKMAETFETIIGRMQQIALTLTTSASEISSASKEQETIVVEQEATTHEIAIAANEISTTAKEFAITMNDVSVSADQTSDLALKGKDSLNNMELIMHNMVDASGKIANKLAVLKEKASNITSVITTITKVADQTNLLSLNASIEAEKAGEYGRSFAVIAREIRRLADQTAIATLDIEKMVNEIMSAVSSSVMGVDDFNHAIREGVEQVRTVSEQLATIIERVQSFTSRFEIVNQGMQAQSTGAEQINEAIAQLSQTARQTTEAIHQFHKTIQELNQASNELNILNPFLQNNPSIEDNPPFKRKKTDESPPPSIPRETKRHFNQTISDLNITTSRLKDVNEQLKPSSFKHENPS